MVDRPETVQSTGVVGNVTSTTNATTAPAYGVVSVLLLVCGCVICVFAIFQLDASIAQAWLAGPTIIVVGVVLVGKVVIDWSSGAAVSIKRIGSVEPAAFIQPSDYSVKDHSIVPLVRRQEASVGPEITIERSKADKYDNGTSSSKKFRNRTRPKILDIRKCHSDCQIYMSDGKSIKVPGFQPFTKTQSAAQISVHNEKEVFHSTEVIENRNATRPCRTHSNFEEPSTVVCSASDTNAGNSLHQSVVWIPQSVTLQYQHHFQEQRNTVVSLPYQSLKLGSLTCRNEQRSSLYQGEMFLLNDRQYWI